MPGFGDMIAKFNAQAEKHQESQSRNPFSGGFSGDPTPRASQDEYGRPVAGSRTEERGMKAKSHIHREIRELCEVIYDLSCEIADRRKEEDDEYEDDGSVVVPFGELFEIYTHISNKVVGLLIAAKRKGFVYFEKEMLFQRRDDDEIIALTKPIEEIRELLRDA